MGKNGVLLVSNRLPVNIVERDGRLISERSIGGVATALDAVAKRIGARWLGWTGNLQVLTGHELDKAGLGKEYVPVQTEANLLEGYYDRFSNGYLWPLLHGKRPALTPSEEDWRAYQAVNWQFAQTVMAAARPDDVIWIHDYHLMLLPLYLRELGVKNRVGYFLHIPFPQAKKWEAAPYAYELAEGISQADLIGVQTRRDARRLKNYLQKRGVEPQGSIRAFPIGIDYEAYHTAAERSPVRRLCEAFRQQSGGKKIIFSLSRLDYTKGIITQLRAVKKFLSRYPHRKEVVYKLVVAPSREHLPEYDELSKEVAQTVDNINADLGSGDWQPIDYEHKTIGFDEATAWYNTADLLLLLPDADGMNLISKEYVAARQDDRGMAVLSTAMGAAEQLDDALLVPPDDPDAAASALNKAIEMSDSERPRRWRKLRTIVQNEDIFWWADRYLATLQSATRSTGV